MDLLEKGEMDKLNEVCANCGFKLGSHSAGSYVSSYYDMFVPYNCCPGHEGRMDWDKGPGTVFKSKESIDEKE